MGNCFKVACSIAIFCILFSAIPVVANPTIQTEFISSSTGKQIEYFWSKPEGIGPFPLLVLIHPNQDWPNKIGGKMFVESGFMNHWVEKGWVTVAVSQPGFGESKGSADFCGPKSQEAVELVLKKFSSSDFIKKNLLFCMEEVGVLLLLQQLLVEMMN